MAPRQPLKTPKRTGQSGLLWPIWNRSLANVPEQVGRPGSGSAPSVERGSRLSFWDSFCPAFFSLAFFSSSSFLFLSFTFSASLNRSKGSASSSRRFPNLFATAQPKASGSIVTYAASQAISAEPPERAALWPRKTSGKCTRFSVDTF